MSGTGRDGAARARRWAELQSSARAVRALPAGDDPDVASGDGSRQRLIAVSVAAATGLGGVVLALGAGTPLSVLADSNVDSDLFALTNQDRTSNGLGSLTWNPTLSAIAESRPFSCSGGVADGRADDMIQRDYFDHPIPECGGQYADIMLNPDGITWTAWGENIAWESGGPTDPEGLAEDMNTLYMNSAPHKANILGAYNQMGTGSAFGASYQGSSNAWLSVEEFIQGSGPAPAPPPRPAPPPPPPRPVTPPVHVVVPVPVPLVHIAPATPRPTPAPTPVPTPPPFVPISLAPAGGATVPVTTPTGSVPVAPLLYTPQGLLSESIEAVLEGNLLD